MDTQKKLHLALIRMPSDFKPFGDRDREQNYGPDCSCDCKFFMPLKGDLGNDWGVCINHQSPRKGLLTFEHQGCMFFEELNQFVE